jgi:hypothetical protein
MTHAFTMSQLGGTHSTNTAARPKPLTGAAALEWLVRFATLDVAALAHGPPGDLPNVLYDLKRWLDLEPDEPLNEKVNRLEKEPSDLLKLVRQVAELMHALAERREFSAKYKAGKVLLHADRLAIEGARALSYRDANLRDAVIRVALDDVYENPERALRIRRCRERACRKLFFANHGAQLYCSHRCAANAAARAYRQRRGTQSSRRRLRDSDRRMETQ